MRVFEIEKIIEKEFPPETAYEWDNVGLLLGRHDAEISKVLVALDVTPETAEEAKACGAELILAHHPILFGGTKRITDESEEGKMLLDLVENRICVYAAHTNCDVGVRGLNTYLAALFGLSEVEFLEENGLGRIGNIKKAVTLADFAEEVKRKLRTPHVRAGGDLTRLVRRVAVGSGACADSIPRAMSKGADVMLTADMKYHEMLNAVHSGICVLDAGHYPTEAVVTDIFGKLLEGKGLEVVKSKEADVFKYL